jgi:hypothetical protein
MVCATNHNSNGAMGQADCRIGKEGLQQMQACKLLHINLWQ